jgi:hypothetical protein
MYVLAHTFRTSDLISASRAQLVNNVQNYRDFPAAQPVAASMNQTYTRRESPGEDGEGEGEGEGDGGRMGGWNWRIHRCRCASELCDRDGTAQPRHSS